MAANEILQMLGIGIAIISLLVSCHALVVDGQRAAQP
jgi:hypothetical protein